MKDLKSYLEEYKQISLDMIKIIQSENYEYIEDKLNQRQEIINNLNKTTYEKNKFKEIFVNLGLEDIQKQVNSILQEKLHNIKENIEKSKQSRLANKSYNNINRNNYNFLNKKV
jgi:Icc-related predicted phosphoesterase